MAVTRIEVDAFSGKAGGWITMTNEPIAVLPAISVARHTTLNFPTGRVAPEVGEQEGVTAPSVSSTASTAYVTTVPLIESAKVSMIKPGRINFGAAISLIGCAIGVSAVLVRMLMKSSFGSCSSMDIEETSSGIGFPSLS
jgi:hypothetical protein